MLTLIRKGPLKIYLSLLVGSFVLVMVGMGYALQEELGTCLPERHAADQEGAKLCHCLDTNGYRYCKEDENGVKHWSYKDWNNDERPTPMCAMSCKEEKCECCEWQSDYNKRQKRAEILKTYDVY